MFCRLREQPRSEPRPIRLEALHFDPVRRNNVLFCRVIFKTQTGRCLCHSVTESNASRLECE